MSPNRNGNFTSSEIVALTTNGRSKDSFGEPFYTYVEECNLERRLGRPLEKEVNDKAVLWGKLVESVPFEMLSIEYKYCSEETLSHPTIECWKGSPDLEKFDAGKTVADIKCPVTLKSFCQLVQPLYDGLEGIELINAIRFGYKDKNGLQHKKHPQGEKYYWQLVSNAILTKAKYAELIVFCPYKSQLDQIRSMAEGNPKYYWLWSSGDDELPYLIENGFYKNLNIIRFEVPAEDKVFLHERVLAGQKLLIPNAPIKIAA